MHANTLEGSCTQKRYQNRRYLIEVGGKEGSRIARSPSSAVAHGMRWYNAQRVHICKEGTAQ